MHIKDVADKSNLCTSLDRPWNFFFFFSVFSLNVFSVASSETGGGHDTCLEEDLFGDKGVARTTSEQQALGWLRGAKGEEWVQA